jgi:hypothetical protein
MSLRADWVDRIFDRLTVRYGHDFARRWEGMDMGAVKADWAHELHGFTADDIAYAMDYLPADRPPTCAQFRDLCRRAPRADAPVLPAPQADPAIVAQALGAVQRPAGRDPLQWAYDLRQREEASNGAGMTEFQRKAWREAIEPRNERARARPQETTSTGAE